MGGMIHQTDASEPMSAPERTPDVCDCGHEWEYHGPEAPGCVECRCTRIGPRTPETVDIVERPEADFAHEERVERLLVETHPKADPMAEDCLEVEAARVIGNLVRRLRAALSAQEPDGYLAPGDVERINRHGPSVPIVNVWSAKDDGDVPIWIGQPPHPQASEPSGELVRLSDVADVVRPVLATLEATEADRDRFVIERQWLRQLFPASPHETATEGETR